MRWYERAMPTIGDTEPYIQAMAKELAGVQGVKNVYVWGSFAENIKNSKYNCKDIDLLVVCGFDSGDLLAVDKTPFGAFETPEDQLEDHGFDPKVVSFTKKYLKYSQYNIDQWALSKDNRLLHWGPLSDSIEEWKVLRKAAEDNAKSLTGLSRKQLCKASNDKRQQWRDAYDKIVQDFISGGPIGWYAAETVEENLLDRAIKLA